MVGVDLPPSWFIAQSAFTANGFVFGADACVLTTRIDQHLHRLHSLVPSPSSLSRSSLALCVYAYDTFTYRGTAHNIL